jgi:hypothetical protein
MDSDQASEQDQLSPMETRAGNQGFRGGRTVQQKSRNPDSRKGKSGSSDREESWVVDLTSTNFRRIENREFGILVVKFHPWPKVPRPENPMDQSQSIQT